MKSMLKNELATAAGVSCSTFRVWLRENEKDLQQFGYKRKAKYLTPGAVRYLAEKYVISVD